MKNIKDIILNKNLEIQNNYIHTCSVSKLCSEYLCKPFDEIKIATLCYNKGLNDPNYKYANMSVEDMLNQWHDKAEISKQYGRLLDEFAGLYFDNKIDELEIWKQQNNFNNDLRLKNICTGVIQFYDYILNNTNYKYCARELPLYMLTPNNNKLNGRFDLLLYDEITDAYIIIDWKTTDNITTNSKNNKLLGPCFMLDECDMNIYTIQLHMYKKSLVETYKLTTENKISVYVCNLLKISENNVYYKLFKQQFEYNNNLLNKCIDFVYSNENK